MFINILFNSTKYLNFDLNTFVNYEQKQFIKKYFFPYKVISTQEKEISILKETVSEQQDLIVSNLLKLENFFGDSDKDIKVKKLKNTKLSNNMILEKYKILDGFYIGINEFYPGSGYIEIYKNKFFVLSSRGILAYSDSLSEQNNFKQIKNNIKEFINIKHFKKGRAFSIKDLFIADDQIFVSYTNEIRNDCWNTSIISGKLNYEYIKFNKIFAPDECVHSENNIDKEFNAHSSGGRIVKFNDNHILLTVGDYISRHLAQNKKSVNGKVIKINLQNLNYDIISMGHRNPQGLFYDEENDIILETEHGPQGGDEINLLEIKQISINNTPNYGWAVVSAGEHYRGKISSNKTKYKKYPLHKSHKKFNFIEPLKSFVPSIGISQISKIHNVNHYAFGSLKDKSIYFFELNTDKKIKNLERVEVFERVRDLIYKDNKIYLFLENTASIGVIALN